MDEASTSEDFNDSSMSPLQRFGANVRRVRLGRSLTQKHLGRATGYSESYVSQVEKGKLLPSEKFAQGCDRAFGTNGLFTDLLHRVEEADHPAQFQPYVELEKKAAGILNFSTTTVMGLLQTEDYARAIFRAGHPHETEDVIEGKVRARIKRHKVLSQAKPPTLWAVLHEACLWTRVGGHPVMAGQLDHLIESSERPGIDIQVISYTAGAAAAHTGPFTLLTFAGTPTVLYSGDPQGGRLCRTPATTGRAVQHYDRLRAHALSPDESLIFLKSARKEYSP